MSQAPPQLLIMQDMCNISQKQKIDKAPSPANYSLPNNLCIWWKRASKIRNQEKLPFGNIKKRITHKEIKIKLLRIFILLQGKLISNRALSKTQVCHKISENLKIRELSSVLEKDNQKVTPKQFFGKLVSCRNIR